LLFPIPAFASRAEWKDALGHIVRLKSYPPQRIISLAPNITEILYSLGVQDRIVGVTDVCKYPSEARKKEKIGGFINPNLEKIVSLNPELVIQTADSNQQRIYDQLVKLKIPVYVINPIDLEKTFQSIARIAELCGKKKESDNLILTLKQRVDNVRKKVKNVYHPQVLFLWSEEPLITAGKNTFTDNLIELAGGNNIAHDSNIKYPKFSMEEILKRKPEIIITSAMDEDKSPKTILEKWQTWTDILAIKNKRVYSIDSDLLARPAPTIVDGLEKLAQIIHPELFKDK